MGNYYAAAPGDSIDGSRYPWGWERPDYDDRAWSEVVVASNAPSPGSAPLEAFAGLVRMDDWARLPSRVADSTRRVLDLLDQHAVHATFFVVGWVIQFVGHYYEGRKPAFVDDLVGLLVGPMFVVAEWMFMLGWNKPLLQAIEAEVGPTVIRDLAHPA